MIDHLPECPLLEPCSADIPQHGLCSRQNTICIHCERECICKELRACEQRVARTREGNGELWLDGYGTGWQDGHTFALDAAREAVAGVLHWSEGELGLICNWNSACDAIDALRGEKP